MKHTLHTRHLFTIDPLLVPGNKKQTLKAIHTADANKLIDITILF